MAAAKRVQELQGEAKAALAAREAAAAAKELAASAALDEAKAEAAVLVEAAKELAAKAELAAAAAERAKTAKEAEAEEALAAAKAAADRLSKDAEAVAALVRSAAMAEAAKAGEEAAAESARVRAEAEAEAGSILAKAREKEAALRAGAQAAAEDVAAAASERDQAAAVAARAKREAEEELQKAREEAKRLRCACTSCHAPPLRSVASPRRLADSLIFAPSASSLRPAAARFCLAPAQSHEWARRKAPCLTSDPPCPTPRGVGPRRRRKRRGSATRPKRRLHAGPPSPRRPPWLRSRPSCAPNTRTPRRLPAVHRATRRLSCGPRWSGCARSSRLASWRVRPPRLTRRWRRALRQSRL